MILPYIDNLFGGINATVVGSRNVSATCLLTERNEHAPKDMIFFCYDVAEPQSAITATGVKLEDYYLRASIEGLKPDHTYRCMFGVYYPDFEDGSHMMYSPSYTFTTLHEDESKTYVLRVDAANGHAHAIGNANFPHENLKKVEAHWSRYNDAGEREWIATGDVTWDEESKLYMFDLDYAFEHGKDYAVSLFVWREGDPDFTKSEFFRFTYKDEETYHICAPVVEGDPLDCTITALVDKYPMGCEFRDSYLVVVDQTDPGKSTKFTAGLLYTDGKVYLRLVHGYMNFSTRRNLELHFELVYLNENGNLRQCDGEVAMPFDE